jgi:L,D-transpeptidase-like protein
VWRRQLVHLHERLTRSRLVLLLLAACTTLVACRAPQVAPITPERTVESVVATIGPTVRAHLVPVFRYAGVEYPPRAVAFLAFKRERRLEIWARTDGPWRRIDARPILAASGQPGPKLREGDGQVPEGIYRILALNPNSRFHLSLFLDYPNDFDRAVAEVEGREDLGGEIFLHGGAVSIGCLAMGDAAIEDLFVLVADVGLENVEVVIAPHDPRTGFPLEPIASVPFTFDLYRAIETRLRDFGLSP